MNRNAQRTFRQMMVFFLCVIFVGSIYGPHLAHGYNSGDETMGHQWIIKKAIEYLKENQRLIVSQFPLSDYLPWLYNGARYADEQEVFCSWDAFETIFQGACDTIHHYGYVDDIKSYGIVVAHPGDFAAPYYSKILYSQAIKFWPGGAKPSLSDLPKKYGGYTTTFFDSTLLHDTWVGGLPFCNKYMYLRLDRLIPIGSCPKWPSWASQDSEQTSLELSKADEESARYKIYEESIENAMTYLGWATHMVQDMTVPFHARNEASKAHQNWEDDVDAWIYDNSLEYLPVYSEDDLSFPATSDYFDMEGMWTAEDFALEARRIALETDTFSKSTTARCVDTAIKLTAAMIEKFLHEVSSNPDAFEENDNFYEAKIIRAGIFSDLNFHVPNDEDWYIIHVDTDYSNLVIDIRYDKSLGDISGRVVSELSSFAGFTEETDYGMKIIMNSVRAGDYRLHLYLFDYRTVKYDMTVLVDMGYLPPDRYEDNDVPETAVGFFTGCDYQNELNIDKVGDNDYYYLYVAKEDRIKVEISFDPTQGELQLYLNNIEAINEVSESANLKKLTISKIGSDGPALTRVTGARNWYSMCMAIDRCVAMGRIFDCMGNCVNEATANSWIGDGYCDDGTWGMDLRCEKLQNDGGDCDPGHYCSPGKINDCVGNCVDEVTALSWVGDGYCDDGTWSMDLRCDAFNDDGDDCKIESDDDYGDTCDDAYSLSGANTVNGSIESVGDYDYFKIETSSFLYTFLHIYTNGGTNTYVYLLDSNCAVIEEYVGGDENINSHKILMAHGGTYYIAVRHVDEENGTGNYTLKVVRSLLGG